MKKFEKLLQKNGYLLDDGCYRKQFGPLLLEWWLGEFNMDDGKKVIIEVYEITPNGNQPIFAQIFYRYDDMPIGKMELLFLEMFKVLKNE